MTLVYRSVFRDADGRIADSLSAEFKRWLGMKDLRWPDKGLSQQGAPLDSDAGAIAWAAELDSPLPDGDRIHRFRLVEESAGARWVTTVASVRGGGATEGRTTHSRIWVDLEHEPTKGSAPSRPGSPRIVRELMATGEGYDGPVPLTAEALSVTDAHVAELISYIVSPDRSVPIIVFAYDNQHAYDLQKLARLLARDLAGVAAVFCLLDATATESLASDLPKDYAVYGGAMRTYLPGAVSDADDSATRHRILGRASLVALGQRAFPAVKDQILDLSTQRPAPVAPRSVARPAAARPTPKLAPMVETAGLGMAWLRQRAARIRAVLGQDNLDSEDEVGAFDRDLDELLRRAAVPAFPAAKTDPDDLALSVELRKSLDNEAAERRTLEELLTEAQEDIEQRLVRIKDAEVERDDMTIEAIEAATAVDGLERKVRWLERRLREAGDSEAVVDESLPSAPDSVAEVVVLAREYLTALELGDIEQVAAELDLHGSAPLYAAKSWGALQALDAYARARHSGEFNNSFYAWCQEPPAGEAAISAGAVAMVESETVNNAPDLHASRVFSVPASVDSSRLKYMPAHIKVVKRGGPAPRLHFHDDAARSGKVYVGYLGAHLPTARFS